METLLEIRETKQLKKNCQIDDSLLWLFDDNSDCDDDDDL
jgi:hypothetical protein